ncbi:MAG: M43 family zinc metalloprotease [Bacteroidota bacterium]
MRAFTLLCCIFLLLQPLRMAAQDDKICGTDAYHQRLLKSEPAYQRTRQEIKRKLKNFQANDTPLPEKEVTIPVVFHVVTNGISAPENLSKWRIYDQLIALNEEFARTVTDSMLGLQYPPQWASIYSQDTRIRFCLANTDPNGKPTSGITRTMTEIPQFEPDSDIVKFTDMGGRDGWPRDDYLNVWICDLDSTSGVAGYATYPGGSAWFDGVVVDYYYFGRGDIPNLSPIQNAGRTLVHEVGHWLDLIHVWGEENPVFDPTAADPDCTTDDEVGDTPLQAVPNLSCDYTVSCGSTDMLINFMNYSPDPCNLVFTREQARRMWATLSPGGFRYPVTQSDKGCRDIQMRQRE